MKNGENLFTSFLVTYTGCWGMYNMYNVHIEGMIRLYMIVVIGCEVFKNIYYLLVIYINIHLSIGFIRVNIIMTIFLINLLY